MIHRVAIANRGEIAVRIAATCRARGIEAVLVAPDDEREGFAARQIGRFESTGPPGSQLDAEAVVAAAVRAGADALHPGYGFLSERPALAEACDRAGVTFIGPSPETLRVCGDKVATREAAGHAGVPLLPASPILDDDPPSWREAALAVGYPLLIKAAGGGGGASLRRVDAPDQLADAIDSARREAAAAGAGQALYLERFLEEARHIEVQVAGGSDGCVAIGLRECSLQRRHQKVIEESPVPALPPTARADLLRHAVAVAEAVGLRNLATVEFLYGADGTVAFIEVNPRLQVEHPVTELVTTLDLVGLQLDIAMGRPLGELPLATSGHAVEARLYAEDPAAGFLPSPGQLAVFSLPTLPGLRVDPGYETGDRVTDRYDPLLAKLIAWGETREVAIARLRDALERVAVAGVATNRPWLLALLDDERVREGRYSTATALSVPAPSGPPDRLARAALAALALDRPPSDDPWDRLGPFRMSGAAEIAFHGLGDAWEMAASVEPAPGGWRLRDDAAASTIAWWRSHDGCWTVRRDDAVIQAAIARRPDGTIELSTAAGRWIARPGRRPPSASRGVARGDGNVRAPLPGKVIRVTVEPGDRVESGDALAILSAMKIEIVLRAPTPGRVKAIHSQAGQQVDAGDLLVELAPDDASPS